MQIVQEIDNKQALMPYIYFSELKLFDLPVNVYLSH